jgi:hypothetical protein
MALSPAATAPLVAGIAQILRRVRLSPRAFRYQMRVGYLMLAGLAAFLCGALRWVFAAAPTRLFRAGAIDRGGLAVLAFSALAGTAAVRRATGAARAAR